MSEISETTTIGEYLLRSANFRDAVLDELPESVKDALMVTQVPVPAGAAISSLDVAIELGRVMGMIQATNRTPDVKGLLAEMNGGNEFVEQLGAELNEYIDNIIQAVDNTQKEQAQ